MRTAFPIAAATLLALAPSHGWAQQAAAQAQAAVPQAGAKPPAEAAAVPAPEAAADSQRPPLDVELEPGGFAYNPQGRRDPFVSLLRPVTADRGPKTRKPGMEGFMVQEVTLRGIVRTAGGGVGTAERPGYIAILLGTDGKSYFVTAGQRLYDGTIDRVDSTSVTFRQEVTDPLSAVKSREVRKSLYASEEARQ
jgi:Tfp pilus assembly protein PilP